MAYARKLDFAFYIVSLRRMAYARNLRLYFPYRQYANILYFDLYLNTAYAKQFVSLN